MQAVVTDVVGNTADVVTIRFLVDGAPLSHQAGQYITVFFDDTDVPEGKAYSLSSAPGDPYSSITVKKVGLFSGKLHALCLGDSFAISQPYGSFNAYAEAPIVAVASGVGIGPVWSVTRDELMRQTGRPIRLFYSNKTEADIIFRDDMQRFADEEAAFSVVHFVTRQDDTIYERRRIDPVRDLVQYQNDHCYYICGTTEFVRTMWRGLTAAGVPDTSISTETFFGVEPWQNG